MLPVALTGTATVTWILLVGLALSAGFAILGWRVGLPRRDAWWAAGLVLLGTDLLAGFVLLPLLSGDGFSGYFAAAAAGGQPRVALLLALAPLVAPVSIGAGAWLLASRKEKAPLRPRTGATASRDASGRRIAPRNVVDVRRLGRRRG